jgi:U3 small nucleolar RNA-associated protein 14
LRVTPPPVSKIGLSTAAPPANPWLLAHEEAASTKVLRKKNEVVVSKDSATIEKSRHKLRKRVQAREEAKAYARADAEVEIAMNDTLTNNKAAPIPESKAKAKRAPGVNAGDDASDADSEVEAQEEILANKRKGRKVGIQAFQQRELVAAAFAGDNVMKVWRQLSC